MDIDKIGIVNIYLLQITVSLSNSEMHFIVSSPVLESIGFFNKLSKWGNFRYYGPISIAQKANGANNEKGLTENE